MLSQVLVVQLDVCLKTCVGCWGRICKEYILSVPFLFFRLSLFDKVIRTLSFVPDKLMDILYSIMKSRKQNYGAVTFFPYPLPRFASGDTGIIVPVSTAPFRFWRYGEHFSRIHCPVSLLVIRETLFPYPLPRLASGDTGNIFPVSTSSSGFVLNTEFRCEFYWQCRGDLNSELVYCGLLNIYLNYSNFMCCTIIMMIIIVQFLTGEVSASARTIASREIVSTIQYGYRKCGTRARVFSGTLRMGTPRME